MPYLLAGPFIALVGIVAVFFVLRRKSVEKRSMYSARRSQIEHKVRAARQRTLTPHGHAPKAAEETAAGQGQGPSPFAQTTYEVPAYEAPPAAPPYQQPQQASGPAPWDVPAAPAEPAYAPAPPEPFQPASEPTPMATPSEPVWTPAPQPSEPATRLEPVAPAASATSAAAAGGWSVVSTEKSTADVVSEGKKKKKDRGGDPSSWQLASGDAPGAEAEETEVKRPAGTVMAIAQYAVLVVGLVMVLIGVLVMVANSHVT
jgi:hypothetical protein